MRVSAKAVLLSLLLAAVAGYALHAANTPDPRAEAAQRDSRWAEPVRAEGLPNLYRVDSEVYRSGQPEGEGLRSAENLGIKTVLSLRSPQQGCRPGQKRGPAAQKCAHALLEHP